MSNTPKSDLIADYSVNVGDGEQVQMSGNPDKLDRIVHQMRMHGRLVDLLEECAEYIRRVSKSTFCREPDFANYDLLNDVVAAISGDELDAKVLYLCSDGWIHLKKHKPVMQRLSIPVPLGFVLAKRCVECGTASEYEAAVKEVA